MATLKFPELSVYRYSSNDPSRRFTVTNPATGKILTTVQGGDPATIDAAVRASQVAYEKRWRPLTHAQRSVYLLRCADELEKHLDELSTIICMENGKPFLDAKLFDCGVLVRAFRFFGSLADKLPSAFYDRGPLYTTVIHEPFGVCVGILPFNWPPIFAGSKPAPALAAGNTFILKPGEQALDGASNRSTAAGAAVARTAADSITPVALELGGKNAMTIFEDADFDAAVRTALEGAFFNKGEACTASSRILVQRGIYDKFVEKLAVGVKKIKMGNGLDPTTHVGPQISKVAQQRLLDYITLGVKEGARIAAQAELPSDPECKDGFFIPATLFADVTEDMRIANEEMFGAIVTVTPFDTFDDAVRIANSVEYGLTAIVFTKDQVKANRYVRAVETGMVWVNNYHRNVVGTPFGGVKHSGYGREHCIETLYEFTQPKAVHSPSGIVDIPEWRGVVDIFGHSGSEVV
ncbi:Aldehyde dehydrogenase [Daldinia childiae]|uniref:Aldehyde dehydrogenase n=1 Tax=Daldinia childiae TaxID=326645 RepID=UPI001448504E|nr:Aldehyde dehydrogenase [Daldinia childiae]KAF3058461.1 Aldehyde dehydrogenase [Daldinia childiae]